jgi:nucleotide-binding universal stress UspA family protein
MYQKILVPVDGSKASFQAVDKCLEIAKSENVSKIVILTVTGVPTQLRAYKGEKMEIYSQMKALLTKDAQDLLDDIKKRFVDCPVPMETKVIWGELPYAIVQEAKEEKYDLIVMGSRGLGGAENLLLGSVSLHVVRQAPCTVMVVRQRRK